MIANISRKRMANWRGIKVAFNQKRSRFYRLIRLCDRSPNFGWVAEVEPMTPTPEERESILAAWRAGRAMWAYELGIIDESKLITL